MGRRHRPATAHREWPELADHPCVATAEDARRDPPVRHYPIFTSTRTEADALQSIFDGGGPAIYVRPAGDYRGEHVVVVPAWAALDVAHYVQCVEGWTSPQPFWTDHLQLRWNHYWTDIFRSSTAAQRVDWSHAATALGADACRAVRALTRHEPFRFGW